MNSQKISIITGVLNKRIYIEDCIQNVLNQTYSNIEHIIMDGGSTDGTVDVIKKYANKIASWASGKDLGIYDAMNKGIAIATGEWLYFLGCDDKFFDRKVLIDIFGVRENLEYDVLYGNVLLKSSDKIYGGCFNSYKLFLKNICHQAIFAKKHVFDKLGYFNTRYKVWADWVFNLKWFNDREIKHKYISRTIAIYSEDGYSSKNVDREFMSDRNFLIHTFGDYWSKLIHPHENFFIIKILNRIFFS